MMKKPLKLGILSDSHRQTQLHHEAIEHLRSCGVDYLLHAGDLEREEHLQMLVDSGIPSFAVYGNNDTALIPLYGKYPIYREPFYLKLQGTTIKMMHLPYYMSGDVDIVISGHTHHFKAELQGKTLFINPGEVCAREKTLSECAVVEILKGEVRVTHYFRPLETKAWRVCPIEL